MGQWLLFFIGRARKSLAGTPAFLPATITVPSYATLPARLVVRGEANLDLPARLGVVYAGTPAFLPGHISVPMIVATPGRIQVVPYVDTPGHIGVMDNTDIADLPARIFVAVGRAEIPARIRVLQGVDLPARIFIKHWDLPARMVVQRAGYQDIPGRIQAAQEIPGTVDPVDSDVEEAVWQAVSSISFSWRRPPYHTYAIADFLWKLDRNPSTEASGATFTSILVPTVSVDLDTPTYGSGIWYFHVAARNLLGVVGPTSTYEVRWNIPPTPPGQVYMRVDSLDTVAQTPLVSITGNHILSWSPCGSLIPGETVTYTVEIASRPDFQTNLTLGLPSVVRTYTDLPNNAVELDTSIGSGLWFWRVMGEDGNQFSGWSPVGGFQINARPGRPTGTKVTSV